MKTLRWHGIPANIPDKKEEWLLLVIVPLSIAIVSIMLAILAPRNSY